MSRLSARRYHELCDVLGTALDHPKPAIQRVGARVGWPVAVYLLGHRDPVDHKLMVDYVGSTVRLNTDASSRIRVHLRDAEKRKRFTCQVILPLRRDLPDDEVRQYEGQVARALGVPRWCNRIPRQR